MSKVTIKTNKPEPKVWDVGDIVFDETLPHLFEVCYNAKAMYVLKEFGCSNLDDLEEYDSLEELFEDRYHPSMRVVDIDIIIK